jgi:uncharacterized protein (DUF1499 family)
MMQTLSRLPVAQLALVAGLLAALLIGGAGPLYRFAGLSISQVFPLMMYGTYAAGLTLLLTLVWVVVAALTRSGRGLVLVVIGTVLAVGAALVPISMRSQAQALPMIHDITTDTVNPPAFIAIAPLRAEAPNGVDYVTDPAEQAKAYGDIETFRSPLPTGELFDQALAAAEAQGWEIVASSRDEGRIEATDTTLWFGFKDDVVIRVASEETGGSRLDIRSMSRVGKSDLGKNAERIRAFLAALPK